MSEQELKLHVPAAARPAIERELKKQRDVSQVRLHALYFDTADRELARARIALRLRQEGRDWIQTLKAPGADAITRKEVNHARPGPVLDLSVYAGTEFEAALSQIKGELTLRYETDVLRTLRKIRTRQGVVELAYDIGMLRAGALELPISEVEFELVSGQVAALFTLGRTWLQRHSLVLDARSKSERGDALATLAQVLSPADPAPLPDADDRARAIAQFWAPRGADGITLKPEMTPGQALAAVTAECLDQIIRNTAVMAEVDTLGVFDAGKAEHVHQLRVGVRRLRSAWRLFEGLATLPPEVLQEDIKVHFSAFGANRDQDVQDETIAPVLREAGMPDFAMPTSPPAEDARTLAQGRAFQGWLLDMLEWSLTPQPPYTPHPVPTATEALKAATSVATSDVADDDDPAAEPTTQHVGELAAMLSTAAGNGSVPGESMVVPIIIPLHPATPAHSLQSRLVDRLRRWHKKVVSDGKHFATLPIDDKHALRKRAKRLRYGLSFAESLLPAARLKAYRKQLAQVQDVLGEFNDLAVAHERYEAAASAHPEAWFAVGWIAARQAALVERAEHAFRELSKTPTFWK